MKMSKLFASGLSMMVAALFVVAIGSFSVSAQTGTGSIRGTVKDPQGNAVAGAKISLRNDEKNFSRDQVTDSDGNYSFTTVPPDTYVLEAEAPNFKKAVISGVKALSDKSNTIDVNLEIGAVTETVNVTATGVDSLVNSQDASLGNNFVSQQILQLPLNARNVGDLLSLQPAVTPDGYVAGGRSDQANLTLDGVDVNEQQLGTAFTPVLRVSPDTVEEFRVITTNADASYGRSSGAQVSFITKSGQNEFHGNLYEYHRNTITTANDFFNNRSGVVRPKLLRNVFGGSLEGPVVKDRFFFFFNYEGRRDARQATAVRIVPLPSLGRGELKFRTNTGVEVTLTTAQLNNLTLGGVPVVDMNPVAIGILAGAAARYPANDTTTGDTRNTGGFRFNAGLPVELNAYTARLDWKLTEDDRHVLFFRGNYQQDITANTPYFPDTPAPNTWSHPLGFVVGHTWIINSKMTNSFRYGLTREAFSDQGESTTNDIRFRSVFLAERLSNREFSRKTPVTNFTNDFGWMKGDHSFQFGTNIRLVRNERETFSSSFDNGITNQSFLFASGAIVATTVNQSLPGLTGLPAGTAISSATSTNTRHALAALMGRLSQYTANFNFNLDGTLIPPGAGIPREFATEEYDVYAQDHWKLKQTLTLTLGLRYGLSRPVYERNGFQTTPNVALSEYLDRRIEAAARGVNFTDPITVNLAGPFHGKPGFYPWDKNNFQPRASLAWSPNFRSGLLGKLFGADSTSVLRGGFAITNDYFGQALAVNFNANNTLGFGSSFTISANTHNITTNPGPLITGPAMAIRGLPTVVAPGALTFPQQQPQDFAQRIEGSLDTNLVSPINYSGNLTFTRKFPKGLLLEGSYLFRLGRNLLATRDVMGLNNIVDTKSGRDWYSVGQQLEVLRQAHTPISAIPNIPWFDNIYGAGTLDAIYFGAGLTNTQAAYAIMASPRPGTVLETQCNAIGGCFEFGNDWTFLQLFLDFDTGNHIFFQSQYGALSAFGTIAKSDYHGGTLSLRQRHKGISWDLNYTLSKSMDDASGLQTSGVYGSAFILNALRQRDNRSVSDFDIRHIVNFNSVWELPFGRGRHFLNGSNKVVNGILGGWQLSTIFRWNSGRPVVNLVDLGGWPTNWNVRSNVVRIRPISASPTRGVGNAAPNIFSDRVAAYQSFRNAAPGETGDRSIIRYPGYVVLDAGLAKEFQMPWNEGHKIQIRWEVFNVTNTQRLTGNADNTFGLDPHVSQPGPSFGNFTGIQGTPRIMQFAFRFEF